MLIFCLKYMFFTGLLCLPLACGVNDPLEVESISNNLPQKLFNNVVLISVDGLRSDAIVSGTSEMLPNIYRMLNTGSSTLNARTDPYYPVTLPSHVCMLTGRLVNGRGGHGWVENVDPDAGDTLHLLKKEYVAGMFDVAHDHGVYTALFSNKNKFSLFDFSWNELNGMEDKVLPDDGKDKIDDYRYLKSATDLTSAVIGTLDKENPQGSLTFVHYAQPDYAGHYHGWDLTAGSDYMKSVVSVDTEIGKILDCINSNEKLAGKTTVILTADHGGGGPFKSHDRNIMWVNYIIPFLIWYDDDIKLNELYEMNTNSRSDPGIRKISFRFESNRAHTQLPPIYNADAANLALDIMGLPTVPGSTINVNQDLEILSEVTESGH